MLNQYLKTALRRAHYEILADDGQYYGEIAECNGVYATAPSLEACRDELEEVLEEWSYMTDRDYANSPSDPGGLGGFPPNEL